jgi:type I restriction enzyme R subunit
MDVSEKAFEAAIEAALLSGGPDAPAEKGAFAEVVHGFGGGEPGGYSRRDPLKDFDRNLCLIPRDTLAFVIATQPKEWAKLKQHHGADVSDRFVKRLAGEITSRGTLDVLRNGIKDSGCQFDLAYFRPVSGLNEDLRRLYLGNVFSVVRQLHYSLKNEKSIDTVLFLNGLPIFTAELKNPFTGQTISHAISQYQKDRDPREPFLAFRRCLAHFAVDPDLVFATTRLNGMATRFLPFNQGKFGGAGNPPVPPTRKGFATSYLWEQLWARESILNLIQHFVHDVEEEDDEGRRTGRRFLIFPRYHQLYAVRRLVDDARGQGAGRNYLIEHSAGSGKSNSIAWLAHQLSVLHDAQDKKVFDSVVVITDRKVLDRQLQKTVFQFQQTLGVVENIDKTSRQLKEALESGKTIIVTTLQKFPVIADQIGALPGHCFAVIVDEAHSSQTGESTKSMKTVLATDSLEAAELEEEEEEETLEDRIVAEMRRRGRLPNVSTFAFTATPKAKTLELFGTRQPNGSFEPFSLYSMRQAIEEGFILDVLENYTTYKVYWNLLKKISEDPRYDREKASYLLRSFVDLHPHAVEKKIEIMVNHFAEQVAYRIGGRAKAMIVTRSRKHAVRYKLAVDAYLKTKGYPHRALVAFSGTVRDNGADFTEAGMNGFPEAQTAAKFKLPENRILVVASKFQTGFDQPLLHTMYVDKKLGGVNAVQTLSRLNRVHPGKSETMVLDFANEAEEIQKGFQPYYEKTLLERPTDPNLLYDLQTRLVGFEIYTLVDVEAFARIWFSGKATSDQLYSLLAPLVDRFKELPSEKQAAFRSELNDYVRLYAFLSQVITFTDSSLEKLYVFGRLLRRYLPPDPKELPYEVQQKIEMESYRIERTGSRRIELERGTGSIEPVGPSAPGAGPGEDFEPLSRIIKELNERFGTDFTEEDRYFIRELEEKLAGDPTLKASVLANTPENARLTFDHVVNDRLQDMVETNFDFYKRVTDDRDFSRYFLDWLFERFRKQARDAGSAG